MKTITNIRSPKTAFCWECGKKFVTVRGIGRVFAHILGYDGHKHDVHRSCVGGQFEIREESNHA